MAITTEHRELLEEEWYHVRHSGEIPEIALHSSLHFLTEDEEGPKITLCREGMRFLLDAANDRFLDIILRDITPANRDANIYRGVLRTISNWRRYKRFCDRHKMNPDAIRQKVAEQLYLFLENEIGDVKSGRRQSCINCTIDDISSVAFELGLSIEPIRERLEPLCLSF